METIEKVTEEKIEVICHECGKKFKTTQEWFDQKNVEGNLPCRKCRFSKFEK
jgi:DNA-directed RNA polymerase subunit RPC12/RpoP